MSANPGIRKALTERNRLREQLAAEMATQRAKIDRRERIKRLSVFCVLIGAAAAGWQRFANVSLGENGPGIKVSPDEARKVLAAIKEQMSQPETQLIGAGPSPAPSSEKMAAPRGPEYERDRPPPFPLPGEGKRLAVGGEYGAPNQFQLELVKKVFLSKKPPPRCGESYFALTPPQAAGLPPQHEPPKKAPVREDYEITNVIPFYYSGNEAQFPK